MIDDPIFFFIGRLEFWYLSKACKHLFTQCLKKKGGGGFVPSQTKGSERSCRA